MSLFLASENDRGNLATNETSIVGKIIKSHHFIREWIIW